MYIMGLPFITSVLKEINSHRYDDDKNYNYIGFDIKKYLDPNVFTYKFIFENDFDIILGKLIMNLSTLPALNDEQMMLKEENYLHLSINYNLQFLLEIKRIDLFLNQLDNIQFQIDNNIIGNCVFQISSQTFQLIFKTISNSIDSLLFQRLIKFSSFSEIVDYLNDFNNQNNSKNSNFIIDYIFNNFNIFNFILLNYFNQQYELKIRNNINVNINKTNKREQEQQQQQQQQSFISNYWNSILNSFKKQISKHTVIKYNFHNLFIDNNIILSPENLKLFYYLCSNSIVLFNSISKNNRNDPFLKVTKSRLLDCLRNKKFNFLKYLYDSGHITNHSTSIDEDDHLLDFLKSQFKNHPDYNLVNWLK